MPTTLAAYVYDATTGLAKRTVVSDDYATPRALKAMHCAPGEDALVVQYAGTFDENRIAMAIARLSTDEIQAAITAHCKIEPPPKVKYALTGPTGRVFEVVETRNPQDRRLQRHDEFEQTKAARSADIDAALAVVAQYPDLSVLKESEITKGLLQAHSLVGKARQYGVIADTELRADPVIDPVVRDTTRKAATAGFVALAASTLDTGDIVQADGVVLKLVREPVPADDPGTRDIRTAL